MSNEREKAVCRKVSQGLLSEIVGLCFLGLRFLGLRFLGLRFLGLRLMGLRFMGLRFLGLRFLGLRFMGLSLSFLGLFFRHPLRSPVTSRPYQAYSAVTGVTGFRAVNDSPVFLVHETVIVSIYTHEGLWSANRNDVFKILLNSGTRLTNRFADSL